jgi:nucleotide-binding universal stress UspA family protein
MELLEQRSQGVELDSDVNLERYAAMIGRLCGRAGEQGLPSTPLPAGGFLPAPGGNVFLTELDSLRQAAAVADQSRHHLWFVPPATAPVLRRLLVPVDYSEGSAASLRVAIDLARRVPRAKCLTLHVYFHDLLHFEDWYKGRLCQDLAKTHDTFMAEIDCHQVPVEPLFIEGACIPAAIHRVADERAVDLIVMTSRGRSSWASLVLPSVARQSLRHARTAFLLLRQPGAHVGIWQALCEKWCQKQGLQFS